jgi:hypothetical protein
MTQGLLEDLLKVTIYLQYLTFHILILLSFNSFYLLDLIIIFLFYLHFFINR